MPDCTRYYSASELREKGLDNWKTYRQKIKQHFESDPEAKNACSFWGLHLPVELKAAAKYFHGNMQEIYCRLVNERLLEKRQVDFYKAAKLYSCLFGHRKTIGNWRKSNMQYTFYLLLGTRFTDKELSDAQATSYRQHWIEGIKCDVGEDFACRVRNAIKPLYNEIEGIRHDLEAGEEATFQMNYFHTLTHSVDKLLSGLQNSETGQLEREKVSEILECVRLLPNLAKSIVDSHAKKVKMTKPGRHKNDHKQSADPPGSYVLHELKDDDDY